MESRWIRSAAETDAASLRPCSIVPECHRGALTRARLYTLFHTHFVPVVTGHPRAAAAGDDLVRRRHEPDATLTDTMLS